jgi:hypothetical protein
MAVSAIVGLVTAGGAAVAALATGAAFGLAAFATAFAIGAGISMVARALMPVPDLGEQMRGTTVTSRDPAGPRKLIYGQVRVGGNVVFIAHSGTDNKYLHLAVVFASHHINSYEEVWFNDNKIWTRAGGFQSDWGTYVTMDTTKLGTATQSASSLLTPVSQWTSDHKLSGIAYIAFKLEWNQDKFPQGVPNITAVIKGKRVFDPRTNVTGFSTNPALCVRDYLLDQDYGLGESNLNIDSTAIEAAADLCDEQVSIDAGGTQDRYQCNGVIDTSNQIKSNIEQLLSSMGGRLTYSGGKYFIDGAEYRAPTVTIDETVIISGIKTQTKQSRRSIYNSVKGTFISEEKNYKILDYPVQRLKTTAGSFVTGTTYRILFVGTTDFTAIGASSNAVGVEFTATGAGSGTGTASSTIVEDGAQIHLDMPLPFVSNNLQAQRLAKIALLKSRQQVVISMTVNLAGLKIKVGDTISVNYDKLGYSGKVFEVIGYDLAIGNNGQMGVQLECIETASAIYDWTTADEEDFLSGGELDLYDGRTVDNVTSLSLTEIGLRGPDGGVSSSVQLTWTAPDDAFIEYYKIRYNKNGTTDYFEVQSRETNIFIPGLDITSNYDFRVQAENLLGVTSTGTTLSNQALNGDTTAPGVPTSPTATGGVQTITCEWNNPTDIDYAFTEVHVVASDTEPAVGASPTAKIAGEEYVVTGLSGAVTKYFFLRAVDFSGNKSAYTSSVNAASVEVTATDIADDAVGSDQIADDAVTADQIADGAVELAAFASGIQPVQVVSTLPSTAAQGDMAFLTTDSKLYRYNGTAWTVAVDGGDIVANSITAGQIQAGAIGATEISVTNLAAINSDLGTLTAGTIDASAVTVSNLSATNITAGTLDADRISIDGVTLDTNASGQLIIADDGVSDDQVLSLDGSQTSITNLQVANLSGDVSEVFNLSVSVYPYHNVPDGSANVNTFAEFTIPAPDSSLNKYASLNGKVKYIPSTSLDDCILVMQFERKSKGTSSGTLIGGVVGIVGSGTTGLPYQHYVEISGNHTKEIDAYGGIAQSQTSPSNISKPQAVEYKSATNRTRIIYSGNQQSTPTYTTGSLYYNPDRWISSSSWLDDAAGAQRYPIPDVGSISAMLTLPLNQPLAKSSAAEDYRVRVYTLGRSTGTLNLASIDSQIFLMT